MSVSKSATATARGQPLRAILAQVVKQVTGRSNKDLCANRHAHNQVNTAVAGTIRSFTVRTALGFVRRVVTKVQQRVQRRIRNHDHVATASAVASRWTTTRHKLFAPESRNAVTSVTPLNVYLGAINKHPKLKATPGARSICGSGVANLHENSSTQQSAPLDKR